MTDRELMQQALEALEPYAILYSHIQQVTAALRERLAQPEQEPVAHSVVAGALFDLYQQMGMRREEMTDKEIMQQALEALNSCRNDWDHIGGEEFRSVSFNDDLVEDAKAVLNERLAQPEPAPGYCQHCKQYTIEEPLPAQPEQETVMAEYKFQTYAAYKTDGEMKIGVVPTTRPVYEVTGPLHVVCQCDKCKAQPEQEPVAWMPMDDGYYCVVCGKYIEAVDGVIVHDAIPHPPDMTFDEEEKPQ